MPAKSAIATVAFVTVLPPPRFSFFALSWIDRLCTVFFQHHPHQYAHFERVSRRLNATTEKRPKSETVPRSPPPITPGPTVR